MKILHLLAPSAFGGLEQVVLMLATGQAEAGHRVLVGAIVGNPETNHLSQRLQETLVESESLVAGSRAYLEQRRLCRDLLNTFCPDVVHTHGYHADVLLSPLARAAGIETVSTVHGFTGGTWKNRLYERLQVREMKKMTAVVTVSELQRRDLIEIGLHKDQVVHIANAFVSPQPILDRAHARDTLGYLPDDIVVGWVGRLSPEKNPHLLLRALQTHADIKIALVGDGPMMDGLKGDANELGMADRVTFHGVIRDVAKLYAAFDVLALTSNTEGVPIVLFEAMHADVPIVSTKVGGVPEVLSQNTASLVEPGDQSGFSEAIRDIVENPTDATTRAARAKDLLKTTYNLEQWVAKYDGAYGRDRKGT